MKGDTAAQELARLIEELGLASPTAREKARARLKRLTGKDYGADPGPWREWWEKHARLRCNRCGKPLFDRKVYYRVKTRLTSEPTELHISEEEMSRDTAAEMEELFKRLEGKPVEELEDEVFVLLDYYLCLPCKRAHVAQVRKGPGR